MTRRTLIGCFVLVASLTVAACGDSASPSTVAGPSILAAPVAGQLAFSLDSPASDDGAIWLHIQGPDLGGELTAAAGLTAITGRSDGTLDVLLAGPVLKRGVIATLSVPDVHRAALYSVQVVEVSDQSNAVRTDVGAYGVTLAPVVH